MEKIQNLFLKDINRQINGVIKADTQDELTIKYEVEEYVITSDLIQHFKEFLEKYSNSIRNGGTEDIGVWISGFFGSGKSHLLKMFGTLIGNNPIDTKYPYEYFLNKTEDKKLKEDLEALKNTSCTSILFNIDAVSNKNTRQEKNSIASTLLREFYSRLGFTKKFLRIANFERNLWQNNRYEEFKERFLKASSGLTWEKYREEQMSFKFELFAEVASEMGELSKDEAIHLAKNPNEEISIEDFTKLLKMCLDKIGKNQRVAFLLDEIGQYIGDSDELMLNLQTVSEKLGTELRGRAWILVTAQELMDNMVSENTKKKMEFSKIQGRFKLKLNLTSANVGEVIQKRILEKTIGYGKYLEEYYEENGVRIDNALSFSQGTKSLEKYKTKEKFRDYYPVIPYQAELLQEVLENIRKQGHTGKHLSDGARSLLTVVQNAVQHIKTNDIGSIVSFNLFFEEIQKAINADILKTIQIAAKKNVEDFDIEILKVLFMIKDIVGIKTNVENLATLMMKKLDEDKSALENRIKEGLARLKAEYLVTENSGVYKFLTDEEQSINRYINEEIVPDSIIKDFIMQKIFTNVYISNQIRSKRLGNSFSFNQQFDDKFYGKNNAENITLCFISQNSVDWDHVRLAQKSRTEKTLFIKLDDNSLIEEAEIIQKINQYADRIPLSQMDSVRKKIITEKREEARERESNLVQYIKDAILKGTLYLSGDILNLKTSDVTKKITDGLEALVDKVYEKNGYIRLHYTKQSIENLLKEDKQQALSKNDIFVTHANAQALQEFKSYIDAFARVSLKEIYERFNAIPYGFNNEDIAGLLAEMIKNNDINLLLQTVKIAKENISETVRVLMQARANDRSITIIEKKTGINPVIIRNAKKAYKEMIGEILTVEDGDQLAKDIKLGLQSQILKKLSDIFYKYNKNNKYIYPGYETVKEYRDIISNLISIKQEDRFLKEFGDKLDDMLDLRDEFEDVYEFFFREFDKTFDQGVKILEKADNYLILESSLSDNESLKEIKAILISKNPLKKMKDINILVEKLSQNLEMILNKQKDNIKIEIEERKNTIISEIQGDESINVQVENLFKKLSEEIEKSDEKRIMSYSFEIKRVEDEIFKLLKEQLLWELNLNYQKNIELELNEKNADENIKDKIKVSQKETKDKINSLSSFEDYKLMLGLIKNYYDSSMDILKGVLRKKPEVIINPKMSQYKEFETVEQVEEYIKVLREKMRAEIIAGNKIIF